MACGGALLRRKFQSVVRLRMYAARRIFMFPSRPGSLPAKAETA
jgi:hypothetical protein